MSMADFEAAQARQKRNGVQSWYDRITPEMTEDRRESLDAALKSPKFTARAIAEVLADWGYDVPHERVTSYRKSLRRG